MPKKKKKVAESFNIFRVYGVWSYKEKELVFISLTIEESELKYDIEEYDEDDYALIEFDVVIDINSLEL